MIIKIGISLKLELILFLTQIAWRLCGNIFSFVRGIEINYDTNKWVRK